MTYTWKTLQELGWAVAVAVVTYLSGVVAAGIPVDKAAWLALGAGVARAVLAAIVAFISPTGGFQTK